MLESGTWIISKEWWKPSVGLFRKRPPWANEDVAGRVERRKKVLSNNNFLFFSISFSSSHTLYIPVVCSLYISPCCLNSFDSNVNVDNSIFGNTLKQTYVSCFRCIISYNRFYCSAQCNSLLWKAVCFASSWKYLGLIDETFWAQILKYRHYFFILTEWLNEMLAHWGNQRIVLLFICL